MDVKETKLGEYIMEQNFMGSVHVQGPEKTGRASGQRGRMK